jgi:thioredoxin 1
MGKTNQRLTMTLLVIPILASIGCTGSKSDSSSEIIQPITSVEHFTSIIENAGNRLIAFDLYADWCMPCKVLAPTLNDIAKENQQKITIYKIDTDQFPQITAAFGATGIPFVVFVKNKHAVHALMGVQPKDSYKKIIETYSDSSSGGGGGGKDNDNSPGGKKVEGIKVFEFFSPNKPCNLVSDHDSSHTFSFRPKFLIAPMFLP